MTATASYTVFCDTCTDSETPNMDLGNETAAEARAEATYHGFLTAQPGGRDYCSDCVGNGKARADQTRLRAARKALRRTRK